MPILGTKSDGKIVQRLIKTVVLARHGKAVKVKPDDMDEARQLNRLGFEQARRLGAKFTPWWQFDCVLSSPLPRARMTMAIATCGRNKVWDVPELTCSTSPEDPVQVMWTELGNVPLANYFEHRLGGELKNWAEIALSKTLESLSRLVDRRGGNTVLVGGHAILQNALLWAITQAIAKVDCWAATGIDRAEKMALETILGEGEAFIIKFPCHETGVTTCEYLRLD